MLQWGFSGADIRDWLKSLLFGIEIGQFRISLVRILAGIVLFIALLFATRLFQRWLRERAAQSRMDPGIANSIDTVVGYVGMAARRAAGDLLCRLRHHQPRHRRRRPVGRHRLRPAIDRQQLRLGADPADRAPDQGRRPHRRRRPAGPRAPHQRARDRDRDLRPGQPDRAELRADHRPRAQLDAPRLARRRQRQDRRRLQFRSRAGASPSCTKCAEDHPQVLRTPAPSAALESFGDSALLFNLRVSLPDIDKAGGVQSDLRVAIFKALRCGRHRHPVQPGRRQPARPGIDQALSVRGAGADVRNRSCQARLASGKPAPALSVPARRRRDVGRPARLPGALSLRGRPSRAARGAPALPARGWRWDGRRGA